MNKIRFLFVPFGLVYWCITSFRNFLFNKKIKRSLRFSLPIINVGNLSMGGTGKSPHIEMLIELLKHDYKLSTLSRGYGRKVYGFQIADESSSAKSIGDEPFQFYQKFGSEITVSVDADRVNGVTEICTQKSETNLVLLDDAFQHRNIKPGFNILLTDYSIPFYQDYILPVGTLREPRKGKNRADIIVVTKCPDGIGESEKKEIGSKIKPNFSQEVFFSSIVYGAIKGLTNFSKAQPVRKSIVLVTGIASAAPLVKHLSKTYNILKHFEFNDHYAFKEKDIAEINDLLIKFAEDKPAVITTEKDAMRLIGEDLFSFVSNAPWYYQEIKVEIDRQDQFNEIIKKYVQENSRDY